MTNSILRQIAINLVKRQHPQAKIKNQEPSKQHSLNGDPISHALESITLKLVAAGQDATVLAEITSDELAILIAEIESEMKVKINNLEKTNDQPF